MCNIWAEESENEIEKMYNIWAEESENEIETFRLLNRG